MYLLGYDIGRSTIKAAFIMAKMAKKILVIIGIIAGVLMAFACQKEDLSDQAATELELTGDNLDKWLDGTGDWYVAGDVNVNESDLKKLNSTDGSGLLINGSGNTVNIISAAEFGDVRAHIEFMVPEGSNSGCYFMGRYEIQVLDSYGVETPQYLDCGGIYQRWDESREPKGYEGIAPRVNASLAPGEWQTFDVIFRAPRFNWWGKKVAKARFEKVIHNGVIIHEQVEVTGPTRSATYENVKESPVGPLMLQGDHGPVAYRNIRITPLVKP